MIYLLDTNVVSETRKIPAGRADAHVAAWASSLPGDSTRVSAITIFELEIGVLRMERRDPVQGRTLRRWFDHLLLRNFTGRILPVDADVARRSAQLHIPDPRPDRDAYIAATALVHGLTVVTRNTADFAGTGVPLLDPWRDPAAV